MLSICPKCGNYKWDKEVIDENKTKIRCPECGETWNSKGLPLFILSGCSGVGKTTTAQKLVQIQQEFVVLDVDFFCFMSGENEEDWKMRIERQEELSADIMQAGKPVLWSMAGCLDKLKNTYHAKFFNGIYCLALTSDPKELERRMREGRGIEDQGWIQSSVEYDQYFMEHDTIGGLSFETLDTTGKSTDEVAEKVLSWAREILQEKKS